MNGKLNLSILIFIMLFVAGCGKKETYKPVEDVGMIGVMAFDYVDEDSMKLTVAIPQYSPQAKESTQFFTVTTDLVSKGISELERQSDKKVVLNQMRVVLIGEEFARKGEVQKVIRHIYRNPDIGNKVLVAVVKESGEELMKAEYPDKPGVIFYLNDLLQPTINLAFNPNTNIHDYIYTQTNPAIDPIVPLLELNNQKIDLVGIAVFKDKEMLKSLTPTDALIVQILKGNKKLAPLYVPINENEKLMLNIIDNKVKMKSNKNAQSPKITINVSLEGALVEVTGEREASLKKEANITKLEKSINAIIEEQINEFFKGLKEDEVDPIGLSENFRKYYNGKWDTKMTRETMGKLEWDIKVDTSIISKGILH